MQERLDNISYLSPGFPPAQSPAVSMPTSPRAVAFEALFYTPAAVLPTTFSGRQQRGIIEYLNHLLRDDDDLLGVIPVNTDSISLASAASTGVLLAKFINACVPGRPVDTRAISLHAQKPHHQVTENHYLVLNTARSLGCDVTNVSVEHMIEDEPAVFMHLLWEITRVCDV